MSGPVVLVLPHTASPQDWTRADVLRAHVARGFRDVGYHELVLLSGGRPRTVLGRPYDLDDEWEPWEVGAHVRGHNRSSWGCALVGDYEREAPPVALLRAAAVVFAGACLRWGLDPLQDIRGHRELASTLCPGRFIDLDGFRSSVAALLR